MSDRDSNQIRRMDIENMYRDIFFESPELKDDPWLSHRYYQFRYMEDEGERAPPIAQLFEDEPEEEVE